MSIFNIPRPSSFGQHVTPNDGAKLWFYEAGTTTLKNSYTTSAETVAHSNPVVADARGVFTAIYISGLYKTKLTDKNDVLIWEEDDLVGRDGGVILQGTFDSSTNGGDYPVSGSKGDMYEVSTGFTLNAASGSHILLAGDHIIANKSGATGIDADWNIIGTPDRREIDVLTDGATIDTNLLDGYIHTVTIAGNRTLANPTNLVLGEEHTWLITQDGTGDRTLAFGSYFKFKGNSDILSEDGRTTIIKGVVKSSTEIHCFIAGNNPISYITYRMINTESTGTQAPVGAGGSDWEISDDTQNEFYFGPSNQVTESSGVFSLGSTGHWQIDFVGSCENTVVSNYYLIVEIESTLNNSTYSSIARGYCWIFGGEFNSFTVSASVKITDITNQKIRLKQSTSDSGPRVLGNGAYNLTYIKFTKMAEI